MEEKKASVSKIVSKVKLCDDEIRKLNFQAIEKNAVLQHTKKLFESQMPPLDTITNEYLPLAVKMGSVNTLRGIVPSSIVTETERVSLESKDGFSTLETQIAYNVKLFQASQEKYNDTIDHVEHDILES